MTPQIRQQFCSTYTLQIQNETTIPKAQGSSLGCLLTALLSEYLDIEPATGQKCVPANNGLFMTAISHLYF
ncbi:hypothetical protein GDO86_006623 [Hymenochirus boettgeri]|uniref:Uncharacterized protein n=1 Tax=Hymenochirus boettgeri TaxID=247094 RepID=A0A8T2J9C6_9PIPI|nr:hypothetical protein GDO86_006623 [Hymenochirus boettgeri]